MKKFVIALSAAAAISMGATSAQAAGGSYAPAEKWSWTGFFGSFDKASAQRGLQVYKEVCAACHGLNRIAFRNLADLGYTEDQIKGFAAENFEVEDGPNDEGEMFTRPAKPSDRFPNPFPNEQAAIAANGAMPPDLSLIVKARAVGEGNIPLNFVKWISGRGTASGADYIYHLMTGYVEEDQIAAAKAAGELAADFEFVEGKSVNKWFPGHNITMAPPMGDEAVEYADGTPATLDNHARDIATFLAWASEPELEQRKEMGIKVILFLVVLLGLTIAVKRRLWAGVKH